MVVVDGRRTERRRRAAGEMRRTSPLQQGKMGPGVLRYLAQGTECKVPGYLECGGAHGVGRGTPDASTPRTLEGCAALPFACWSATGMKQAQHRAAHGSTRQGRLASPGNALPLARAVRSNHHPHPHPPLPRVDTILWQPRQRPHKSSHGWQPTIKKGVSACKPHRSAVPCCAMPQPRPRTSTAPPLGAPALCFAANYRRLAACRVPFDQGRPTAVGLLEVVDTKSASIDSGDPPLICVLPSLVCSMATGRDKTRPAQDHSEQTLHRRVLMTAVTQQSRPGTDCLRTLIVAVLTFCQTAALNPKQYPILRSRCMS